MLELHMFHTLMLMPLFRLATLLWLALCSLPLLAEPDQPVEKVSLQLKWLHSFQFAGYYAAKEKGFYAEENLDVTIRERIPGISNIEQVLKDESQYGVADTGLLLEQRLDGKPVVVLASIFQHNPLVYLTLKKSGIVSPYELKGKRVMEDSYDNAPLLAMLYETGISPDEFTHLDKLLQPRRPDQRQNSMPWSAISPIRLITSKRKASKSTSLIPATTAWIFWATICSPPNRK